MKKWTCTACGMNGLIKPEWGEHEADIVADSHRDQNSACNRENGSSKIVVSVPRVIAA